MFGDGSQMPDMSALLAQAQQMQEQLLSAKEELDRTQVTGTAGGGLVSATVTGGGDVVAVDIKAEAADPDDTETLGDLVVAAIRDARAQADRLAADKLGPFGGGGMPDLMGGGPGEPGPGGELPSGSGSGDGPGDQPGGRPPLGFS